MATIVKGKNPRKPYTIRYQHDGRQRERSFTTQREAKEFKAKFEHDSRDHSFTDPRDGKITVAEYADTRLARVNPSPRTLRTYKVALDVIRDTYGRLTLAQAAKEPALLEQLLVDIGKSASWRETIATVVKTTMDDAVVNGKIARYGLGSVKVVRTSIGPRRAFPSPRHRWTRWPTR
jgi:hypothetical protein